MIPDPMRHRIVALALRRSRPLRVAKMSVCVPMSAELVAEAQADADAYTEWMALPAEERAARQEAARATWQAQRDAQYATAHADWEATRDRYATVPAVLAVLDIHYPNPENPGECAHPVGGWEADPDDWPCDTYTAIKEA